MRRFPNWVPLVSFSGSYRGSIGGRAAAAGAQFHLQSYSGDTNTSVAPTPAAVYVASLYVRPPDGLGMTGVSSCLSLGSETFGVRSKMSIRSYLLFCAIPSSSSESGSCLRCAHTYLVQKHYICRRIPSKIEHPI